MTPATVREALAGIEAELARNEREREALTAIVEGYRRWLALSEPSAIIPETFREPDTEAGTPWDEAIADPATVAAIDEGLADVAAGRTTPLTVERLTELGHVQPPPAGGTWTPERRAAQAERARDQRARQLAEPKVACTPGCGQEFSAGPGFALHRRTCPEWDAYRVAHTVDKGGRQGPAPLPEPEVDVAAERDAFAARRTAGAKAKAARHPGEARA